MTDRLGILLAGARTLDAAGARAAGAARQPRALAVGASGLQADGAGRFRVFAQADRLWLPAAGRAALVESGGAQQNRSTLLSATWNRNERVGLAWTANMMFAHASSSPALSGTPIIGTMERLRDGPVYELASASGSRRRRTSLSWRGDPAGAAGIAPPAGVRCERSWTGVTRDPPGASLIGELWMANPRALAVHYRRRAIPVERPGTGVRATNQIPVTSARSRPGPAGIDHGGVPQWDAAHIPWRALSPRSARRWRSFKRSPRPWAAYARYAPRLPSTT